MIVGITFLGCDTGNGTNEEIFTASINDTVLNTIEILGLVGTSASSSNANIVTVETPPLANIRITSVSEGIAVITISNNEGHETKINVSVLKTGTIIIVGIEKYSSNVDTHLFIGRWMRDDNEFIYNFTESGFNMEIISKGTFYESGTWELEYPNIISLLTTHKSPDGEGTSLEEMSAIDPEETFHGELRPDIFYYVFSNNDDYLLLTELNEDYIIGLIRITEDSVFDASINGTWIEEKYPIGGVFYVFHNGNYETGEKDESICKGTYSTSNGIITITPTHYINSWVERKFDISFSSYPDWISKEDLEPIKENYIPDKDDPTYDSWMEWVFEIKILTYYLLDDILTIDEMNLIKVE